MIKIIKINATKQCDAEIKAVLSSTRIRIETSLLPVGISLLEQYLFMKCFSPFKSVENFATLDTAALKLQYKIFTLEVAKHKKHVLASLVGRLSYDKKSSQYRIVSIDEILALSEQFNKEKIVIKNSQEIGIIDGIETLDIMQNSENITCI